MVVTTDSFYNGWPLNRTSVKTDGLTPDGHYNGLASQRMADLPDGRFSGLLLKRIAVTPDGGCTTGWLSQRMAVTTDGRCNGRRTQRMGEDANGGLKKKVGRRRGP